VFPCLGDTCVGATSRRESDLGIRQGNCGCGHTDQHTAVRGVLRCAKCWCNACRQGKGSEMKHTYAHLIFIITKHDTVARGYWHLGQVSTLFKRTHCSDAHFCEPRSSHERCCDPRWCELRSRVTRAAVNRPPVTLNTPC
jgi:hypothetical protein